MLAETAYPYREIAAKVALAGGVGLLIGLEREWAKKEMGARTFAITALLGMLSSLLADNMVLASLIAVLLLVTFLNIHSLLKDRSLELTTSIALVVVFVLGAMVGKNHFFTAATAAIVIILLLSWKFELGRFAGALRREEIRSAVLLGLLSVVIFPLLPDEFVDRWELVNPRQAWTIVVVIAGLGFLNYILLRLYSARGILYAAIFGGLVNSSAAATELSMLFKKNQHLAKDALGTILLTDLAMFVRNAAILAILAAAVFYFAFTPLALMAFAAALFSLWRVKSTKDSDNSAATPQLNLPSPVSLSRVLKLGLLFLTLSASATLAQRYLGSLGFLVVAAVGGLISSASTTASAASLASLGKITPEMAALSTVLTSITSALVTIPLVHQQLRDKTLTTKLFAASVFITAVGIGGFALVLWVQSKL